ncbi:nucleoside hydrolase, partial [Neoconidiobolus thromboides FSU 785]
MIIDTDPGVDDILALLLAFRAQHVDVKSICLTHGNTNLNNVMRNFCSLFHTLTLQHNYNLAKDQNAKDLFSKPNLPRVAIGSTAPMKGDCFAAEDVHGSDGFGNLTNTHPHFIDNEFKSKLFEVSEYNAVDEILFQLKNNPPFTITIVTLGPLTNLAKAIQKDAYTVGLAKHIYIMGGACKVPGNVTTEAEFNFFADGYAAKVVLDAT